MKNEHSENHLILLPSQELELRLERVRNLMRNAQTDAILITDNTNLLYLTGRVFAGYIYIPADAAPLWLVRRPEGMKGQNVAYIRKPEEIPQRIAEAGLAEPRKIGFENDLLPYSTALRLQGVFPTAEVANASPLLRTARAIKTEWEIAKIRESGVKHTAVYRRIPSLFSPGMTDIELQWEIENLSRREGCLGQFRISGPSMEFFMGNVLTGDNADAPTPYDFAMGGAGQDPSLPVGACGETIKEHNAVMVDFNGNFTGYMTDMTRVFRFGTLSDEAMRAHQCSLDICRAFKRQARPGAQARDLYEMARQMAAEAGLEHLFMGHRQHAGFVGHGIGLEINELPVIAPRSRDILEPGNVIALEPKFVIPGVGAVGIENTYVVGEDATECLTLAPEEIIALD